MKTKVLIIAVLLGFNTLLMAQSKESATKSPSHGPEREMRENDKREHENALNLTDAQKEAFKQSMLAMQKKLQPIRNELGEAEAHQKTLMTAEKPDLNDINKNIEKIGSLKTEMAKLQAKNRLDLRAQLTEEQRLKFDMHQNKMRHGEGPEGMRHGREMHEEKPLN
jgi:Spy/CpxP family protein refolding chaperone